MEMMSWPDHMQAKEPQVPTFSTHSAPLISSVSVGHRAPSRIGRVHNCADNTHEGFRFMHIAVHDYANVYMSHCITGTLMTNTYDEEVDAAHINDNDSGDESVLPKFVRKRRCRGIYDVDVDGGNLVTRTSTVPTYIKVDKRR